MTGTDFVSSRSVGHGFCGGSGGIRIESDSAGGTTRFGRQVQEVISFTFETLAVLAMGAICWTGYAPILGTIVVIGVCTSIIGILFSTCKHITSLARITSESVLITVA